MQTKETIVNSLMKCVVALRCPYRKFSARQKFDNFRYATVEERKKMARVLAIVFLHLSVLLVLALSATTDGLPLEDRLEQLTRDFVRKLN